jgi:heme A synthase
MRRTYFVLASLIAGLVVVQAAAIALGFGGLAHHVAQGGTFDKTMMESQESAFTGDIGFPIHGINGGLVIPLVAIALFAVSFFARFHHAVRWAGLVLGLVIVQVMLGYSIVDLPYAGAVHGGNALALFATALLAARAARRARPGSPRSAASEDARLSVGDATA